MLNRILLIAACVVLLWAAALGFGFVDNIDLAEDFSGWLALGLALGIGSSLDWRS